MKILYSAFELLGVVLIRFRPLPRVWAILLIFVNLASVIFIDTIYGQVVFTVMCIGLAIIVSIHCKLGFVRLLGIGHIFWIPMLAWLIMNIHEVDKRSGLSMWMLCLITFNSISLMIDTIDVSRFILGDRKPHYTWKQAATNNTV